MRKGTCIHSNFGVRFRLVLFLMFGALQLGIAAGEDAPDVTLDVSCFGKTVRSIEYASDLPLDRSHYDPYIGLQPGDTLTHTVLKSAIQSLYDSRRFSSIVADAFPQGDGVRVRFVLQNNYYFNKFSLEGDLDLKGRALWEWVSLPVGERFTRESLEKSREAVLKFMKDRGYYLAKVQAEIEWDESSHQVNVLFIAQPGDLARIRSININIADAPDTVTGKLLDKFGFKQGQLFDRSRLADRMEEIRAYFINEGRFAAVTEIYEDFDPETNSVALDLSVYNYKVLQVLVEGYKIEKDQLQRFLAVLTEGGSREDGIRRGADKLAEYLKNSGYPEAKVTVHEEVQEGTFVLRYRIDRGRKFEIALIRFQGCTAFTEQEMLDQTGLRPSSFLHSSAFSTELLSEGAAALKSLYESRGYLAANVDYDSREIGDTDRFVVTYNCTEGSLSRVHAVDFSGNTAFTSEELSSRISLKPGAAYSPTIAERDRQNLLAAYSDAGYLQAKVTAHAVATDADDTYNVAFEIEEGTQFLVDHILVLGNDHTRESVVTSRIKLKTGDPLSLGKLLDTQQALYRIGIFDQVRVGQQNPDSRNPYQNIVVRLRESQRFTVRYGLGYQEREKLRGILEFSDLNVFGLGRRADIQLRGSSTEQGAAFNLRQTQFQPLPVDSYLSLSASYTQEEFGDIRRFGVSYQFSRPLNDHSWAMFRYNFKNVFVLFGNTVPSPAGGTSGDTLQRDDTPVNLSTFSVAYINDSRDNYLDPTVGFFSSTEFGVTTKVLGEKSYVSFFTQNSYFRKLPKSFLTAVSLRIGVIKPYSGSDVPISERFFAGGGSSLRGFDTDFAGPLDVRKISDTKSEFTPRGGNALFVGSVELRRPVLSFIHLAGFYDTGNVFDQIHNFSFAGFSHTVGAGLRIKTPLGPLRIDYGYNLNLPAERQYPPPPITGLTRGHLFVTVGPPF